MHTFIQSMDGWKVELLRDDGDDGCSFIEEAKKTDSYTAVIRYEEHERNKKISIEAVVFKSNGKDFDKKTLEDALFLEEEMFEEENCRPKAAAYAHGLKQQIDQKYFLKKDF